MELVFFYINQTSSKFIEKMGFNFSANWNFYVEYIDEEYVLKQNTCKNLLPKNFFDEQGCITNITAIVGENGTGKTTLLNMLSDYYGSIKDKDHDPAYDDYFTEKYEKDKTLSIYLEDGELVCYHNMDNFRNETEIKKVYLHQDSIEPEEIVGKNKGFENISKMNISNSMYSVEDGVSIHESIGKISLNVNSLKTVKNIFYNKKCKKNPVVWVDIMKFRILYVMRKKQMSFSKY